jgi:hypothetical protein
MAARLTHVAVGRRGRIPAALLSRSASATIDARSMALPALFAVITGFSITLFIVRPEYLGGDARIYAGAARIWLEGGNPWTERVGGMLYGGPPTMLVPYLPLAYAPPQVVGAVGVAGMLVLAIFSVRSLGLPYWWLAWPPLVGAITQGNPDVAILALLVLGRGRLAFLAPLWKAYAIGPLLGDRRWRAIAIGVAIAVASVMVLPYGLFLRSHETIAMAFDEHLDWSAWGYPVAMVATLVALAILGPRRALWLGIPALMPGGLPHYEVMALPVITPEIAAVWSLYVPLGGPAGIIVGAVRVVWGRRGTRSLAGLGRWRDVESG